MPESASPTPQARAVTLAELLELDPTQFLSSAYLQVLGRPVDPQGFSHYSARLQSGVSRTDILLELQQSAEGRQIAAQIPGLVAALAQHGIAPSPAKVSTLRQLLRMHDEAFVDTLYAVMLDRAAQPEERQYQADRLRAGLSKMALLADTAAQVEATRCQALKGFEIAMQAVRAGLCPVALDFEDLASFDDEAFVDCAYKTLIGRPVDAAGLSHYLALLRNGYAKAGIAWRLSRSTEGRRHGASLPGLTRAGWLCTLGSVPLLGRMLGAWAGAENDRPQQRRLRAVENRLQRVLTQCARERVEAHEAVRAVDALLSALPARSVSP